MKFIKKYKGYIVIIIICIIIEIISTKSYAFFNYSEESDSSKLSIGSVYVDVDYKNTIDISTNPIANYNDNGNINNPSYLEFSITGANSSNKPLYYDLKLEYGDDVAGKTRISDELLRFRLEEVDSNGDIIGEALLDNKEYASINKTMIYEGNIPINTEEKVTKYYKLYVFTLAG